MAGLGDEFANHNALILEDSQWSKLFLGRDDVEAILVFEGCDFELELIDEYIYLLGVFLLDFFYRLGH